MCVVRALEMKNSLFCSRFVKQLRQFSLCCIFQGGGGKINIASQFDMLFLSKKSPPENESNIPLCLENAKINPTKYLIVEGISIAIWKTEKLQIKPKLK